MEIGEERTSTRRRERGAQQVNSQTLSLGVEDDLAGEDGPEVRHDDIAGQVDAKTGASDRYGPIMAHIAAALRSHRHGTGWQLVADAMKVRRRTGSEDRFYSPDPSLGCDPADRGTPDRARPRLMIAEVLSELTEGIDRGETRWAFRTLDRLQQCLPVAQDRREVLVYRGSSGWASATLTAGTIRLHCLCGPDRDPIHEDLGV